MFSGGNERRTYGAAGPLCECWWTCRGGEHMSECSGSDTVFIALPSAHFREVRIECHLTKRPFFFFFFFLPPKSLRYRRRRSSEFRLRKRPFSVCLSLELPRQTPDAAASSLLFFSKDTHTKSQHFDPEKKLPPPPKSSHSSFSFFSR